MKGFIWFFVFWLVSLSIDAQHIITVTAESAKDASRKALQEYLESIVDLSTLNDFRLLSERKKSMQEDPLPYVEKCLLQENQCFAVSLKVPEILDAFLARTGVVKEAFPHSIGIVGEEDREKRNLLTSFGFKLIDVSNKEQKRLQEMLDDQKSRALWMKDNHLEIVIQIFPKGDGRIFNLLKTTKEILNMDSSLGTATQDMSYSQSEFPENVKQTTPLTARGRFLGTPAYSAPEQIEDALSVTTKADIWSWGVVALELLTKTNPFDKGKDIRLTLRAVKDYQGIGDVSPLLRKISPKWQEILELALVKDAAKRSSAKKIQRKIEKSGI